jgi:AraC family transcriptional regulator, transcriptional activator of pobA
MEKIPIRRIKTGIKEPDFYENFSIRNVQDLLGGNDMVQELHRHDHFYILALEKGNGQHEIDFSTYKVCNHSVFFMRPGQVHQLLLKAGAIGYLMQFKTAFYYPQNTASNLLLRRVSHKNFCQIDAESFKRLFAILVSIFQEYTDKLEGYQDVIKANLGIFFIELLRNRQNNKVPSNTVNPYTNERLEELLSLLETHIHSYKKVSQYADMLNLSSYQLNAITKTALGKTCSELINEHILLEAKRQLLSSSHQVNQIALELGYDDVSYFIRFFKRHIGSSPEAFRTHFR